MARKKLFGLMARRPGLTSQAFHDHYRHPHGTIGLHISTLRDYVQSHQIHTDLLGQEQARYEAVAELWFDNGADLETFRSEPAMVEYLNADEWNFVDMRASEHFIGEEEVLTSGAPLDSSDIAQARWRLSNRPTSIKLMQFYRPDAAEWCGGQDGALGVRLKAFRHVRCHPTTPASIIPGKPDRPAAFAGVRELWWPTLTAFHDGVAADAEAWRTLTETAGAHAVLAQAERFR